MAAAQHLQETESLKISQRRLIEDMKKIQSSRDEVSFCWEQAVCLRQQPIPWALPAGGSAPLTLLDEWRVLPAGPGQAGCTVPLCSANYGRGQGLAGPH